MSVRVLNAALDEIHDGQIVLRGRLDPESLDGLLTGEYQREVLPLARLSDLVDAFRTGQVPDIELGMRGQEFKTGSSKGGVETITLQNSVYIIDGLQRVSAARLYMRQTKTPHPPALGCVVYFGTNETWERKRFRLLNVERNKVSPNILLRNLAVTSPAVDLLYQLTARENGFVLGGRVCWANHMTRQHILSALTVAKSVGRLHKKFGPGRSQDVDSIARGLDTIMTELTPAAFRANIETFFGIIDEAFKIRLVTFRVGAAFLKQSFLYCLADIFGSYDEFWVENRLVVDKTWVQKLAMFPIGDPQVGQLAGASGASREILRGMIVRHLNAGRRSKRLSDTELLTDE